MGMELLSPVEEYYIQLSYYSLIAIFQKTGLMHIQACHEQYLFNDNISLSKFITTFVLRCATKILKIGK